MGKRLSSFIQLVVTSAELMLLIFLLFFDVKGTLAWNICDWTSELGIALRNILPESMS